MNRPLAALAACLAAAGGWAAYRAWTRPVRLGPVRPFFYHDEFVEIELRTHDGKLRRRWREGRPPRAAVLKDGARVATIAGVDSVELRWSEPEGAFVGRWPCPWNAAPGPYELRLLDGAPLGGPDPGLGGPDPGLGGPDPGLGGPDPGLGGRLTRSSFEIHRRSPKPLPPGFVALTLETKQPLGAMKLIGPDGTEKGWRGLLDWAQYLEADAFWMLIGETPGRRRGELWRSENLPLLPKVAEECRKRGLALGVYAMAYLTTSREPLERYECAWDVVEGRAVPTRAISLRDPRRPGDVAELLRGAAAVPGVEYVGLDYIRNALGGYELADDFFAEMPGVRPPPYWASLDRQERMVWFHRKKVMRQDLAFIDAWQWWRAHRVGQIVRQVRDAVPDKSLWAFTLSWEKGWQHGQDPVMMNDAGVDADALMLYQADARQFELILRDLRGYLRPSDAQVMVGDIVDGPHHQRRGPRELRRRLGEAIRRVYADGRPPAGLFIHDAGRALWGRLGPHTTRQWMNEARKAVRQLRDRGGRGRRLT